MISDYFYKGSNRPVILPLPLTLTRLSSIFSNVAPAACTFYS